MRRVVMWALAAGWATWALAVETVTVRPVSTDEVLSNPGMGLYAYQFSNRLWAYGTRLKPGDTMDWFPGVNIIYFRVPWCELEPAEGDYRWDVIDSVAQNWIAKGKQIAIRVTCCENRYQYPTPKWVFDAGAKYTEYSMYENFKRYWGKASDVWSRERLYEPVYTDPVFLQKLENFLRAFAKRYDGNPAVAFCDVGTFGMWGEGHTDYTSRMSPEATLETVKTHMALWRKCLPNTYLVVSDDVSGWASLEEDPPAMRYARELGIGFRDDSIMVEAPSDTRRHQNGRPLASWYHDNWARIFAKTSPVVVEHEHYDLSNARRNCWRDEWLVKAVEDYEASYLSVHGWPDEIFAKSGPAYAAAARRLGYRFELREAAHPAKVTLGEPFEIRSSWVNVGVARCYAGATLAWTLLDESGAVVWTSVDYAHDFKNAQPKLKGTEVPFALSSRVRFGCTSDLPDRNDGVINHYRSQNRFPFGKKVPTMAPGTYTLAVSLGTSDGTPTIALPLAGGRNRRYPLGKITVASEAEDAHATVTPGHSFTYGGVTYRGVPANWPRETKDVVSDDGARTVSTTVAREPGTGLEMSVVTTRYRDLPVVEWTLSFENKGTNDTKRFTRIAPGDFAVPSTTADRVSLWRGIGESTQRPLPPDAIGNYSYERRPLVVGSVERMGSSGGFPNWRAFPYFRLYGPEGGYTVAIGWQGQWTAEVSRVTSAVKVEARQETVDFHLKPGEKAISPTVTVMRFADDDDAVNGWRRFMRRWILPRAKDGVRPIRPILGLDGDWCGGILYGKMREQRHLEQIHQLHEKGLRFDIWWIDAGWYQRRAGKDEKGIDHGWYSEVGDWTCDPQRFPSGSFAKISEALAECGAMLTLWHEPERVSEMCGPFFERAKPYLVPGGNERCRRYDLTRGDAVEFLSRAVGGSIRDNRVGFYREDCNQTVSDGWRDVERQRGDGRRGLVENQFVQGRFKYWENLRKVNPNLYFDICAGGGRRNDLSTLRFPAVPLHYTDIGYTNYVMKCRAHHMCHEWLFFRKNLDSFYHTRVVDGRRMIDRRKAVIDLAEQHMVHAAAVLGDKRQEAEEMELIAAWRQVSDYLIDGDYYLLTPEVFGDDRWWVTEFRNPDGDDGFLQVVRNPKSPDGTCRVTLRGVTPGRKLVCSDLFSGRSFMVVGGEAFDLSLPPDAGTLITFKPAPPEPVPVCAPNFSFVYKGVEHRGVPAGWTRTTERRDDADGARTYVTTRATEPGTGLALVLEETRYRDLPVCEWEVSFENGGTSDSGRLTRLSSLDWDVPLAAEDRRLWHGVGETDDKHADRNYWFETLALTNGMDFAWQARQGYPSYYTFPYFRLADRTGGYTVALGYQGQWAGALTCRDGRVNVRAGQETVDFYLKPGERAISPKVTVVRFADSDDAVNVWRRFMRRYVLPRAKDGHTPLRPLLAGGHHEGGCLFVQTTEKGQLDAIRRLAGAGIFCDTWWIDAGWYTRTSKCSAELLKDPLVWYRTAGDWTSDPERLPNGFKPIADELARHGGNLTLWFEPERLYETNPFMETARPYLTPKAFGGSRRYDLSRPDAVAFLGKYIGDQLDANDVGIFRQDSNGSGPLAYWRDQEAKLNDGRHGFVENLAVRGEFALWKEWRRRRPHMLFDTCASGGRRNDLSTLRFPSVPLHYSDTSYGDPIAKQRHYHMMNEWLFYHKNSSGHFSPGGRFSRRIAVSQLAQFFHVKDRDFLEGNGATFRAYLGFWRRLAPLTIDGDYYLLTPEIFGDDRWWVTEFFDPKKGEGFLQVVRNPKSTDEICEVTLKGLRPGERVTCEDLYARRTFEARGGEPIRLALKPDDGTFIAFHR